MKRFLKLLFLILLSCSVGGKGKVVLSNVPMYSVALDLCDSCDYHVIVRGTGHMHFYEPTPKDQALANSACAFVRVERLDEWARGWKGKSVRLPDPHFWLYREGVETVAETLDAVLRKCQRGAYPSSRLEEFKKRVDSLFSIGVAGRVCASSFAVERFLSNFPVEIACVLQGEEFKEPSPTEVERFKERAKEVGVVVRDTGDVLPPLPKTVKVITLNLHPRYARYGERYSNFLERNVRRLGEGLKR